jgi:HD-GYP domain-containing protein (c-di-GMP phosphodiesterase class II)
MIQRRITMFDLNFGQPLTGDLFSADGKILLCKGEVLTRNPRLESLVQNGLFADPFRGSTETPSVLRMINVTNKRLERLLFALSGKTNAQSDLIEIANSLMIAVNLNPNIALACIFLNQIGGSYAVRHCIESAIVVILAAQAMQKPRQEILTVTAATLTMNVGMLGYHEQLQSQRSTLSHEELSAVRRHPEEGVNILKHAGIDNAEWVSYVLLHHENEDGSGYPFGKNHTGIPQNAKLIALADRYCAQVSARNYRKSVLPDKALREIFHHPQHVIDPDLAHAFTSQLGSYPPGTFVRLENGEIGVVSKRATFPRALTVHALIGPTGVPLLPFPIERETGQLIFQIQTALHEDEAGIRFNMKQIWGPAASL